MCSEQDAPWRDGPGTEKLGTELWQGLRDWGEEGMTEQSLMGRLDRKGGMMGVGGRS